MSVCDILITRKPFHELYVILESFTKNLCVFLPILYLTKYSFSSIYVRKGVLGPKSLCCQHISLHVDSPLNRKWLKIVVLKLSELFRKWSIDLRLTSVSRLSSICIDVRRGEVFFIISSKVKKKVFVGSSLRSKT